MQTTDDKFKRIVEQGGYKVNTKLLVNGSEYTCMSMQVNCSLFSGNSPTVGGCVSSEIDADIVALSAEIPRMAKLEPYVQVANNTEKSGWIRKGIYYIDTRHEDSATGILSIHGYDALMKAEKYFSNADINAWGTTKKDIDAVNLIASRIGVQVDARTVLGKNYAVPKPSSDDSQESMREILGYIGAAYGGNWIITFDGKLLLCKLGDLPQETFYLCNEIGTYITFGGDRIVL